MPSPQAGGTRPHQRELTVLPQPPCFSHALGTACQGAPKFVAPGKLVSWIPNALAAVDGDTESDANVGGPPAGLSFPALHLLSQGIPSEHAEEPTTHHNHLGQGGGTSQTGLSINRTISEGVP